MPETPDHHAAAPLPESSGETVSSTTVRIERAQRGDSASLESLVREMTPLLIAQAAYHLGAQPRQAEDAEDVVAETWLVAMRRLKDLQPRNGRLAPVLVKFLS